MKEDMTSKDDTSGAGLLAWVCLQDAGKARSYLYQSL